MAMEVRVHGIGGPSAEHVLGLEEGSGTDAVWPLGLGRSTLRRGRDPAVGVYHWAPLTSGSRWFALWPLALPFTLLNVAGWMHAPGRRAVVARLAVRLLGLALTVSFVAWLVIVAQVLLADRGQDTSLGLWAAGALVAVVVVSSQWSSPRYERMRPPSCLRTTGGRFPGLDDGRFFDRAGWHVVRTVVHVLVAVAAFAAVAADGLGHDAGVDAVSLATAAGAVQLVLLVAVLVLTVRRAGTWSLAAFGSATLAVALVPGLATAAILTAVDLCDPSADDPCLLTGDAYALVDVYGWALLAGLGATVALLVRVLLVGSAGQRRAAAAGLLPTAMGQIRARLAAAAPHAALPATVVAVVFVVGAAAAFVVRSPETLAGWCAEAPGLDEASDVCQLPAEVAGERADDTFVLTASPPVGIARISLLALFAFVILNLWKSRASPEALRRLGSIWDVLTFWPRAFHPFAVRPYAERAVPELQRLVAEAPPAVAVDGRLDLFAHSQGSVLVVAALAPMRPSASASVRRLVTFGSPLRSLHMRAFPAYVHDDLLREVREARSWRWVNVFRFTDHVGRSVFTDDGAWTPGGDDRAIADPRPGRGVDGHSHYWTDDRVRKVCDA